MSRINFDNFKDASEYSRKVAMTLKHVTTIRRDGNLRWVDDQQNSSVNDHSTEINTDGQYVVPNNNGFYPDGAHVVTGTRYDPEGFDNDGFNRDGYDREGYDRNGFHRDEGRSHIIPF